MNDLIKECMKSHGYIEGLSENIKVYYKDNIKYAIKFIKDSDRGSLTELNCLKRCNNHPNVVKLFDIFVCGNGYIIVMECGDCALYEYEILNFKDCAYQIVSGLYYLHNNGVTTGDIKQTNIIVHKDEKRFSIIDFGLGKLNLFNNYTDYDVLYSPCYRAPEIWLNYPITDKVESWSLGIILYSVYFEYFPCGSDYTNDSTKTILTDIFSVLGSPSNKKFSELPEWRKSYENYQPEELEMDNLLKDLISGLLQTNPDTRLSITEALNHPYFGEKQYPVISNKEILDKYNIRCKFSDAYSTLISGDYGDFSISILKEECHPKILILAMQLMMRLLEHVTEDTVYILSVYLSIKYYDEVRTYASRILKLPNINSLREYQIKYLKYLDYCIVYTTACDYILLYENIYSQEIINDAHKNALNLYIDGKGYTLDDYEIAIQSLEHACDIHGEKFSCTL